MAGALLNSVVADRFGRQPGLLTATRLFGVGALGSALSPDIGVLVTARFVSGMGIGAALSVVSTYVSEMAPARRRGRHMSWVTLPALWATRRGSGEGPQRVGVLAIPGRVEAVDPHGRPGRVEQGQCVEHGGSCGWFVLRCDRVFQVEDHGVRAGGCFGEPVGPVAGTEQDRRTDRPQCVFARSHLGIPRTRSARMLRMISVVPPAMVAARERR